VQSHLRNNLKYWLPVGFYCAAIFIQSAYPSIKQLPDVPYGDKYLHMLGYFILGSLFYRAFRSLHFQDRLLTAILLSIAASTGYGISDEFHQYFVPYRSADLMDVLADMVGSCIGVMAYFLIMERFDIFPKNSWIDKLR